MSATRRIRLRYILPVLFTILYGVLTVVSDHQDQVFRERMHAAYKDPSIFVKNDFLTSPSNWAKDCLFGIALPCSNRCLSSTPVDRNTSAPDGGNLCCRRDCRLLRDGSLVPAGKLVRSRSASVAAFNTLAGQA